jgi:integrase
VLNHQLSKLLLVSVNPARDVRHRREDNSRVRFLSDAEENKLREVILANWPEHMPEFNLAVSTGLRKGSMYGLTWEMVDLNGRMLNVPTSKNGEPLHIPLNAAALAALGAVYQDGATGRVFQSIKTGNPLENARHWFDEALEKSKVTNFHWHDLRHHFASKLRQKGAKLEDIAELLCHKSLSMTKRYAHLGPNQLHEVASLLDSVSTPVAPMPEAQKSVSTSYLN